MQVSVKAFKERCAREKLRVTPPREHVFGIIAKSKSPLSAYDILDALAKKLDKPKPPTVYRALEFLIQHGFIHRIESLNAYVACAEDHNHRGSQFMICDTCGHVEEVHLCSIPKGLQNQAEEKGFSVSHWNVELHGQCAKCD